MHTFQVHGERVTSRRCCRRHRLGAVVESGWGHGGHSHTGMTGFLRTDSLSLLWGSRKRCSLSSKEEAEHQKSRCSASWPWTCGLQTKKINACCLQYLDCGISLQKPCKRLHMKAVLTAVSKASPHCSPNDKESERLLMALFSQIYRLKQNTLGYLLIQPGLFQKNWNCLSYFPSNPTSVSQRREFLLQDPGLTDPKSPYICQILFINTLCLKARNRILLKLN